MSQNSISYSSALAQQYKEAVDISSIVTKTNTDGKITYVNDEFVKISGYISEELIGKSHSIVSHPDTPDELFRDLWNTISSKQPWKGTIKNLAKDGSSYTVTVSIIPIMDKDENIIEYIAIRHNITELIEQRERLSRQTTDQLTGLPNRESLIEHLACMKSPSLAMININNFRDINELYGFEIGDKTLIFISKIFKKFLIDSECSLYKLPSDEFAILSNTGKDIYYFQEIIIKLVEYIKDIDIKIDNYKINVSISAGLSNSTFNTLMCADVALQNAKRAKKSYITNDENFQLKDSLYKNLIWHNIIKEAIQENRVIPYYQPIYNTQTNQIQKYEALVRIIDVNGDILSPYQFLDIAKKYGQYENITKIMIESSFKYFEEKKYQFSINLSVDDIINKKIVDFIIENIKSFKDSHRIIFEITESEGIENYSEVQSFTNRIKKLGCKIAIDDFGTGYSNFEHIIKLNVDYLKIDGSLIKDIDKNFESRVAVETIIIFAKKLGISIITEHVHNEKIYNIVKELGSDYIQGYYIGEPQDKIVD